MLASRLDIHDIDEAFDNLATLISYLLLLLLAISSSVREWFPTGWASSALIWTWYIEFLGARFTALEVAVAPLVLD